MLTQVLVYLGVLAAMVLLMRLAAPVRFRCRSAPPDPPGGSNKS